jgi:hypothetical protein
MLFKIFLRHCGQCLLLPHQSINAGLKFSYVIKVPLNIYDTINTNNVVIYTNQFGVSFGNLYDLYMIFEKSRCQFLSLICDESLTCRCLNLNLGHFDLFYLYLCLCGESCLLVSWCVGDRCGMTNIDEDHGRSRRPGAEDRRWSHRSGTRWLDD